MTEKRFTRTEVNKIINEYFIHYLKMHGDEFNRSERLFFKDIADTIRMSVDYKLEIMEKGDVE